MQYRWDVVKADDYGVKLWLERRLGEDFVNLLDQFFGPFNGLLAYSYLLQEMLPPTNEGCQMILFGLGFVCHSNPPTHKHKRGELI
jgi:hypothetical protein